MHPATGGVSILAETTDEPALLKSAVKLMEVLRWNGPADVEFKIDERDGIPKLLEVNTRFWGGLDLAIQAGVDFPHLTCELAVGRDFRVAGDYRVGLRYAWPFYGLAYARERPNRWSALWACVRPDSRTRSDIWLRDPLPSVISLRDLWRGREPGP